VAFIEDTASGCMTISQLRAWFDRYIVCRGVMLRPVMVNEPSVGSIPLSPSGALMGLAEQRIQRFVLTARGRVVNALRGLLARPVDDRFLAAAIFAGRVRRRRVINSSRWVANPEPNAPLSGIVLSLLAADILTHRDEYDHRLCICETCGRMSFQAK